MFYEVARVISSDLAKCGYQLTRHNCDRGSAQHRQGDHGEIVEFFSSADPDAKQKADALLRSLEQSS